MLCETAATNARAVAMVDISDSGECGQQWTYAELLSVSERLALALSTRYAPGDKVVVWAPNIPQWVFMEYACGLAGLVLVTANPSFQAAELKYVLEQSGAVGMPLGTGRLSFPTCNQMTPRRSSTPRGQPVFPKVPCSATRT